MKKILILLLATVLIPFSTSAQSSFRITDNRIFESGGNTIQYLRFSEQPRIGEAKLYYKGETSPVKTKDFDTPLQNNEWRIDWGNLKDGFTYEISVSATLVTGQTISARKEFTTRVNSEMEFTRNSIRYSSSGDTYNVRFNIPPEEVYLDIYKEGVNAKLGTITLLSDSPKNNETDFSYPLRLSEDNFYKLTVRAYDKNGDVLLSTKDYIPSVLDFEIEEHIVDLIDSTGVYSPNQAAYTLTLTKPATLISVRLTDRSDNTFHTYSARDTRFVQFLPDTWGSKRLEYDTVYYFKVEAVSAKGQEIVTRKQFRTDEKPEEVVVVTPDDRNNGEGVSVSVPVTSTVIQQQLTLEEMDQRAEELLDGNFTVNAQAVGETYQESEQNEAFNRYVLSLQNQYSASDTQVKAVAHFIAYGVDGNTKELGAGERAAVVNSYAKAYNRLPQDREDLADVLRIANGRWPENRNSAAELRGKQNFQLIYRRIPNIENPQDNAAVTILTYGLKQRAENRNLSSERSAIAIFRRIFNQDPNSTEEWNMVQAIAYSGATQKNDTDGDGLSDEDEKQLGTDMFRRDTDNDGYSDGTEVLNGYSPLRR